MIRKAREAVLAVEIENTLTKQEILGLYLNKIFLGYRSYGVAAAAQTYFGKSLNELTLSEMAIIAGLPKAPSTMNPLYSLKRSEERRNVVLSRMLDEKYISKEEYDAALKEPIVASYHGAKFEFRADYVTEWCAKKWFAVLVKKMPTPVVIKYLPLYFQKTKLKPKKPYVTT